MVKVVTLSISHDLTEKALCSTINESALGGGNALPNPLPLDVSHLQSWMKLFTINHSPECKLPLTKKQKAFPPQTLQFFSVPLT